MKRSSVILHSILALMLVLATCPARVRAQSGHSKEQAMEATETASTLSEAQVRTPVAELTGSFRVFPAATSLLLRSQAPGDQQGYFTIWDYSTDVVATAVRPAFKATMFTAPGISPDGHLLAVPTHEPVLRILRSDTGEEFRQFIGHQRYIIDAAFLPDGKRLISVSNDGSAAIWDLEAPLEEQGLIDYFEGHDVWWEGGKRSVSVGKLAISPDGKLALTGDESGVAILWEIDTRKVLWRLAPQLTEEQRESYIHPRPMPSGFIHAATGKPFVDDGLPLTPAVAAVSFFPDGSRFVIADAAGLTRVLDTQWGWEVARLAHSKAGIADLAVSPDGRFVLVGSNPYPKLWDWREDKVWELRGHQRRDPNMANWIKYNMPIPPAEPGGVRSVAFSLDGRQAITGGEDGTIRFWRLPD